MSAGDPLAVTLEVAGVLEALAVPYLVGGSLASSFHGVPRSTLDADLVADLGVEHVGPFSAALEDRFYLDRERIAQAVDNRSSFNVIHLATMFKVDVFVAGDDPLTRGELGRRQRVVVGDGPDETLMIASAEDTVLQKLLWYRLGGGVSERQWRDAVGVLKVQRGRLDLAALTRWAAQAGVAELLDRALAEAGPPGGRLPAGG